MAARGLTYFTVQVLAAGLSDQLSQLSRLYAVGRALSLTYVHTPFVCRRSLSRGIAGVVADRIAAALRQPGIERGDRLVRFLGLDRHDLNIDDACLAGYARRSIAFEEIFDGNRIDSIDDLNRAIDTLVAGTPGVIWVFQWGPGMYRFGAQLTRLLKEAGLHENGAAGLRLGQRYREARTHWPVENGFTGGRLKVLVHLRKGDRVALPLGGQLARVYGSRVRLFDNRDDLAADPGPGQVSSPDDVRCACSVVQRLVAQAGNTGVSLVVISDGYRRAVRNTVRAALRGEIRLGLCQWAALARVWVSGEGEYAAFNRFQGAVLIVGETEENLFRSIDAIVDADVIVKNAGGFAFVVNRLLNEPDNRARVISLDALSADECA